MTEQYTALAPYYDRLMADVDYGGWCDFYEACFARFAKEKPQFLLDLGCGTGNIALPLAQRGYRITGLDLSAEMLSFAAHKAEMMGVSPVFTEQNMAHFHAGFQADAALCSFDGINYLLTTEEVLSCFCATAENLKEGGLFVFDLSTPYKYENILDNRTFVYDMDDVFVTWQNEYRKASGLCDFFLSFFVKGKDGRFTRTDEYQRQRKYSEKTIKKLLSEAGFTLLATCADISFSPVDKTSDREFYICQKKELS